MCNHNPNDKDTTIDVSKLRVMVSPEIKFGRCSMCGEIIKIKQNK